MEVCRGEAGSVFLDHCFNDVVERQFLDPIVFFNGGQHASGGYNIWSMRVLTFSLRDDRFWIVSSKFFFVVLEDFPLVCLSFNDDIIVDQL